MDYIESTNRALDTGAKTNRLPEEAGGIPE
jgi:hypothetical protein